MNERNQTIVDLYRSGTPLLMITKQTKVSIPTVYKALKQSGTPLRVEEKALPEQAKAAIAFEYLHYVSVAELRRKYNCTHEKIMATLQEYQIAPISACIRENPAFLEHYFENIDTPAKAYWLGWIITDGAVMQKSHAISMTLRQEDEDVLYALQDDLKLSGHIRPFQEKYTSFHVSSKIMCQDLAKYGIVQNKTSTVRFPDLQENLVPHLIRGAFEGDGWISIMSRYGKPTYELGFTGNGTTVAQFNSIVSAAIQKPEKHITPNHSIWKVRWSSKAEVDAILHWMYKDCGICYLKRKRDKYHQIHFGN